jgi:hypothetical protein
MGFNGKKHLSPNNNPLPWVIINGLCAVCSISLFILTVTGQEANARSVYVAYNLITTIIWIIELAIKIKYHAPNWQLIFEIIIVLYFVVDSMRTIYLWVVLNDRPSTLKYTLLFDSFIFILGTLIDAIPFWTNKDLLADEQVGGQTPGDLELNVEGQTEKEIVESQMV